MRADRSGCTVSPSRHRVVYANLAALCLVLLVAACALVSPASAQSAPCPPISGGVVQSGPQGADSTVMPLSCQWLIRCPRSQGIIITNLISKNITGSFQLTLTPLLLMGFNSRVGYPKSGTYTIPVIYYYENELRVTFSKDAGGGSTGGFSLNFQCSASCPATLPAAIAATPVFAQQVNSIASSFTAPAHQPAVCTTTITGPNCPAGQMVSYNFTRLAETSDGGLVDADWRQIWLSRDDSVLPYPVVWPDDFTGTELFYPATTVIDYEIRVSPSVPVVTQVDYYCTNVRMCPAGASPRTVVSLPEGAAILSDYDGVGWNPSAVSNCSFDLRCPYDTNVFMWFFSMDIEPSTDRVALTPCLGRPGIYTTQLFRADNRPWGCNRLLVDFTADPDWQVKGYTLKYLCPYQCALGPASRVVGTDTVLLARAWRALSNSSDMCRWEVQPQCSYGESGVVITILKKPPPVLPPPAGEGTWKFIIDRVFEEFRFVFPDMDALYGNQLYLPSSAYNVSGRVFPRTDADFSLRFDCQNITTCSGLGGVQTNGGKQSGVVVSDIDGAGVAAYPAGTCIVDIVCPQPTFAIYVQQAAGTFLGTLALGNYTPVSTNTASIPASTLVGQGTARIQFVAPSSGIGGFAASYVCVPPLGPTTATSTTTSTASLPTTTTTATLTTASTTAPTTTTATTTTPTTITTTPATTTATTTASTTSTTVSTTTTTTATTASTTVPLTTIGTTTTGGNSTTTPPFVSTTSAAPPPPQSNQTTAPFPPATTSVMELRCVSLVFCDVLGTARGVFNATTANCTCECNSRWNGSRCSACADAFTGFNCSECLDPNATLPDCVVPGVVLAAAVNSNAGVIAGAAVGGLLFLLLLLFLIFLLLRRAKIAFTDVELPFFRDAGRYTKGFAYQGDEELIAASTRRATNDFNGTSDLDAMLLSKPSNTNLARDDHLISPAPLAAPSRVVGRPPVDVDDI